MALNYPGPYELRIHYTVSIAGVVINHVQRLNIRLAAEPAAGEVFSAINALNRADVSHPLDEVTDRWIELMQPKFDVENAAFSHAELWKNVPDSFEASFKATYPIALPGTAAGGPLTGGQIIYTFRTAEGGIMKVVMMETNQSAGPTIPAASLTGADDAIVDFLTDATVVSGVPGAMFLARDTSYPFANIALHPGVNEATFKKRWRAS